MTASLYIPKAKPTNPMRRLRLGPGLDAPLRTAPALPFPGITGVAGPASERQGKNRALLWVGIAGLLHASILVLALIVSALRADQVKEEAVVIPVQLLREEPVIDATPAPAPKALAESRSVDFAPAAQAVAPQVINPSVVAPAAAAVTAAKVDMNNVGTTVAPKNISAAPTVQAATVSAVNSVAVGSAQPVNIQGAAAPTIAGPTQISAPAGPSVGPKQVAGVSGTSIGTAPTATPIGGAGSSVKEGVVSGRDVAGTADGKPIANVNTQVGSGFLNGPGGTGTGQGGVLAPCQERPEVKAYIENIKSRMYARWVLPAGAPNHRPVKLAFLLDASGSLLKVEATQSSGHAGLDQSAMDALRAASPFPSMHDNARCLVGTAIQGTFQSSVVSQ